MSTTTGNAEKETPNVDPNEPLPQLVEIPVAAAEAAPEPTVEICPIEHLEELRDAETHAQELEAQARTLVEQAKILRNHAWLRTARKMKLAPPDSIDLATGAVTRGKPDEVRS